jgi:hydrogenase maturation factor
VYNNNQKGEYKLENQYSRVVKSEGNFNGEKMIDKVLQKIVNGVELEIFSKVVTN